MLRIEFTKNLATGVGPPSTLTIVTCCTCARGTCQLPPPGSMDTPGPCIALRRGTVVISTRMHWQVSFGFGRRVGTSNTSKHRSTWPMARVSTSTNGSSDSGNLPVPNTVSSVVQKRSNCLVFKVFTSSTHNLCWFTAAESCPARTPILGASNPPFSVRSICAHSASPE